MVRLRFEVGLVGNGKGVLAIQNVNFGDCARLQK